MRLSVRTLRRSHQQIGFFFGRSALLRSHASGCRSCSKANAVTVRAKECLDPQAVARGSNNAPRMSGRGPRPLRPACFEASFHGLSELARFCVSIVSIIRALDKPAYIPRPIF